MATIFDRSIASDSSDGFASIDAGWFNLDITETGNNAGHDYNAWFNFNNITVPKDAEITAAYITLTVKSYGNSTIVSRIYGIAQDHNSVPVSLTNWTGDHGMHTTASIDWNFATTAGPTQVTPSLVSIVQEIVSRQNWVAGNNMGFHIDEIGSAYENYQEWQDVTDGTAPVLRIEYNDPEPPPPPVSSMSRYGPAFGALFQRVHPVKTSSWAMGPWKAPATGEIAEFSQYFRYANAGEYGGTGGTHRFIVRSDNAGTPDTDNLGEFTLTNPMSGTFTPGDGQNFQWFTFDSTVTVAGGTSYWITWENTDADPDTNYIGSAALSFGDDDTNFDTAFMHRETFPGSGLFTRYVYGNDEWGAEGEGMVALFSLKYSDGTTFGQSWKDAQFAKDLNASTSVRLVFTKPSAFAFNSFNVFLKHLSGSTDVTATLKSGSTTITFAPQKYINAIPDPYLEYINPGLSPTRGWWRFPIVGTLSAGTPYTIELTTTGNFQVDILQKGWEQTSSSTFIDGYADYNPGTGWENGWDIHGSTSTEGTLMSYFKSPVTGGIDWGASVDADTFPDVTELQAAVITPKTGSAVRLVALSEVGGNPWTTVGELGVLVGGGEPTGGTRLSFGGHHIDAYANYDSLPQEQLTANFTVLAGGGPQGVDVYPGDSIQEAINDNPGQDIRVKSGIHRAQQVTSINNNVTIRLEDNVYIRGSYDISSGWVQEGSNWYHSFTTTPTIDNDANKRSDSPRASWQVDLYEDGDIGGWHVANKDDLGDTELIPSWNPRTWTYWVDTVADRIYMDHDPNGALMEVTNFDKFIDVSASGVTIWGQGSTSVIEHYVSPVQQGAVQLLGPDCAVRKVRVQKNHGGNIYMGGDRSFVHRCYILYGGQIGISMSAEPNYLDNPSSLDNALLQFCEIAYNNIAGFDTGFEAGGAKLARTTSMDCWNNDVHDNYGKGLWWDIDNKTVNAEWNEVYDNAEVGILNEISFGAEIHHNTVYGNAWGGTSFQTWDALRGGIITAASPYNSIYQNTVYDNGKSGEAAMDIGATQQNRWSSANPHNEGNLDEPQARLSVGLRVFQNDIGGDVLAAGVGIQRDWTPDGSTVTQAGPDLGLAVANWGGDDLRIFQPGASNGNNLFFENAYPGTQTPVYKWDNGDRDFAYWQADGNDGSGSGRTDFADPRGGAGPLATGIPDPEIVVTYTIGGNTDAVVASVDPVGDRYIRINTSTGTVATTDKASFSGLVQMEVRLDIALDSYTGQGVQSLFGQWGIGNERSWFVNIENSGLLGIDYLLSPSHVNSHYVDGPLPVVDGERIQIKMQLKFNYQGFNRLDVWYRKTYVDLASEVGWVFHAVKLRPASTQLNDVTTSLRIGKMEGHVEGFNDAGIGNYYGAMWGGIS